MIACDVARALVPAVSRLVSTLGLSLPSNRFRRSTVHVHQRAMQEASFPAHDKGNQSGDVLWLADARDPLFPHISSLGGGGLDVLLPGHRREAGLEPRGADRAGIHQIDLHSVL